MVERSSHELLPALSTASARCLSTGLPVCQFVVVSRTQLALQCGCFNVEEAKEKRKVSCLLVAAENR